MVLVKALLFMVLVSLSHTGIGFYMTKRYRIIAKISELRSEPSGNPCSLFQLGTEFDLSKPEERVKICRWAFNSMLPFIAVLEFGGSLPWEPDPERAFVACPDPHNVVVFELIRKEVV